MLLKKVYLVIVELLFRILVRCSDNDVMNSANVYLEQRVETIAEKSNSWMEIIVDFR